LYIVVSLFGSAYELFFRGEVRWPLIGGYLLLIAIIVYFLIRRPHLLAGDDEQAAE
jgi:hypothetical protein